MICRPRFGHTSAAQGGKSRQTFANIGAVGHTRSASTQWKPVGSAGSQQSGWG